MLRSVVSLIVAVLLLSAQANPVQADDEPQALKFQMKRLDGQAVDLSQYQGKVVMIVNVASKCGLTPQYEQLQALHEKYGDQGLAILGFPCNQFGKQEPGTATEIQEFCSKNYGVSFDLFAKVDVNGDDACELYKFLTKLDTEPKGAGDISWNFEKFVLGRDGQVIARFEPRTRPDDESVLSVVTQALAEK